jgi:hypothetical protein
MDFDKEMIYLYFSCNLSVRCNFIELRFFIATYISDRNNKSKTFPVHAMKAYRGSRGIDPLILNLVTRLRWVVTFKPRPFYTRERTPVHIEWEAG